MNKVGWQNKYAFIDGFSQCGSNNLSDMYRIMNQPKLWEIMVYNNKPYMAAPWFDINRAVDMTDLPPAYPIKVRQRKQLDKHMTAYLDWPLEYVYLYPLPKEGEQFIYATQRGSPRHTVFQHYALVNNKLTLRCRAMYQQKKRMNLDPATIIRLIPLENVP